METLLLSRIQFAANISFHILFPTITIALGWVLLYFKLRYNRTREERWMEAYRFWVKIFALSFAMGVVSGITMSFQFGTNWPGFMETVGSVTGALYDAASGKDISGDSLSLLAEFLTSHLEGLTVGTQRVGASDLQHLHRACVAYLDAWGRSDPPRFAEVRDLADAAYPPLNRLVAAAATHEVERLHNLASALRDRVDGPTWSRAYFAVVTGPQPRYKELSVTYFTRLLEETGNMRGGHHHRVVTLTGDHTIETVLEAVAKRDANRRVAELFTGSPRGLDQDVLGRAAARAIDAVFQRPVRG